MSASQKYVPELVDVWYAGLVLYTMLCGYLPFESNSNNNINTLYDNILKCEYEIPKEISPEAKDLL